MSLRAPLSPVGEEELCEADLPCAICKSQLFTRSNDIIICKERTCRVVVHQSSLPCCIGQLAAQVTM